MADSIIADRARAVKASKLVEQLHQAGATAATIPHLDDAAWTQAAHAARVRAPSPATRAGAPVVRRARAAGGRPVRRPRRRRVEGVMTTMTVEAGITRLAGRVNAGTLCWRCGLGHSDMKPVAGSGRVEHVGDPACAVVRGLLIHVRDQLAEMHKAAL